MIANFKVNNINKVNIMFIKNHYLDLCDKYCLLSAVCILSTRSRSPNWDADASQNRAVTFNGTTVA